MGDLLNPKKIREPNAPTHAGSLLNTRQKIRQRKRPRVPNQEPVLHRSESNRIG